MKKLYFVTGNKNKVAEAQRILDIPIEIADIDIEEIQSLDSEKVVRRKAEDAFNILGKPLFVEDVSAEVNAWNGFPGPLIKFLYEAGGNAHELLLRMLEGEKDRTIKIKALIGYHDGEQIHVIEGFYTGTLVPKRGTEGWGFDPYVVPDGYDKTFAELGMDLKNEVSHRAKALKNLKKFLDSQVKQKKV